MITLTAEQSSLARRSSAVHVILARLRTFSDHDAETVESTFYFSKNIPLWYEWDGATRSVFRSAIRSVTPLTQRIDHLPNAGSFPTRREVTVVLDNAPAGGRRLWEQLRDKNLSYAQIDLATILVDPSQFHGEAWWDLGSASNDHVVRFRGELTVLGRVTETSIPITFESIEPDIDWPEALEPTEVDPKDLGKRYPMPVGQAKNVPCVNRQVGFVTTLAQELTTSTTGSVDVTDTTGFPTGTFEIQAGAERMDASVVDEDTISISNRGKGSTTANAHKNGEVVIEIIASAKIVFSGFEADALQRLYVRSPITGDRIRVRSTFYSVNLADTTLDTGRTLGVATITQANMQSLLDEIVAAASVAQQPAFQNPTEVFYIPARNRTKGADSDSDGLATLSSQPDGIRLNTTAASGDTGQFAVNSLDIGAQLSGRTMVRWRFVATLNGYGGDGPAFERDVPLSAKVNGSASEQQVYTFNNGAQEYGVTVALNWVTSSSAVSTLGGDFVEFYLDSRSGAEDATWTSGNNFCWIQDVMIEVEVVGQSPTRTTDVAIIGTSLGYGLEFSADVDGAPIPSASAAEYEGSAGDLIEHPMDVLRYFIADFCGLGHASIDDTTWDAARANLAAFENTLEALDSDAANWTLVGSGASKADEATITQDGGGSLKLTSGSVAAWVYKAQSSLDFSGGQLFRFRIYLDSAGTAHNLTSSDGLFAGLSTTADVSANFGQWNFGSSVVSSNDNWIEVTLDPSSFTITSGTPDLSSINAIYLGINRVNMASGKIAYFDSVGMVEVAPRFAGDLRAAGASFGEVISRLGFECRTNILESYTQSTTLYKALNADASYAFPSAGSTLSEVKNVQESRKLAPELVNRFRAAYQFDPSKELSTIEAFAKILRADADQNDLSDRIATASFSGSETSIGERLGNLIGLRFVRDVYTAKEIFGYYVFEHLRDDAARFGVSVPVSDGYELEPGDIVTLVVGWMTSAAKCRVVGVSYGGDTSEVGLNLEELVADAQSGGFPYTFPITFS